LRPALWWQYQAMGDGDHRDGGGPSVVDLTDRGLSRADQQPGPPRRHDPRIDPPNKQDRQRKWLWLSFLAFCPICLGVVLWAALDLNGNYPTVKPPVPSGWQAVPGIYASFSVPAAWSLDQEMSDSNGDVYYSGPGGGVGESVAQANAAPNPSGPLPTVVGTFLEAPYHVTSVNKITLKHATRAWSYQFHLVDGRTASGVMAWVRSTQSEIWLILSPVSPTTEKALSTLTLAS
jgi:hypothetical protein